MRRPRDDFPGAWWLLTNRGLAKRPVFETRLDVEQFFGCIADVVARGDLEVHAYAILTTHFHLLAKSPRGAISEAMQRLGNRFVRWFNRAHRRDGSLFHRRFHGKKILDGLLWETVLRYIDLNPVRAGMAALPSEHGYGSARDYRFGTGPNWLSRDEVERAVREFRGEDAYSPEGYDEFACAADHDLGEHIVERSLRSAGMPLPPLGDLVRAASDPEQSWMAWKTRLADATSPGVAFLSAAAARRAARAAARALALRARPASRADVQRDLEAALLRHAAGLTLREIAEELGLSVATSHCAIRRHEVRQRDNPRYEEMVARALRRAVRRTVRPSCSPGALPIRVWFGEESVVETRSDPEGVSRG